MGYENSTPGKGLDVRCQVGKNGCLPYHSRGDSGESGNKRRDLTPRVHQAAKGICDAIILYIEEGNFRDTVPVDSVSGGFYVYDGVQGTLKLANSASAFQELPRLQPIFFAGHYDVEFPGTFLPVLYADSLPVQSHFQQAAPHS